MFTKLIIKLLKIHLKYIFLFFVGIFFSVFLLAQENNNDSISTKEIIQDTITPPVVNDSITNDTIVKKKKTKEAVDKPVDYTCKDSIFFDIETKKIYLYGQAKVIYGDIELTAEFIEFDMSDNVVYATSLTDTATNEEIGRPHFKDKGEEFDADTLIYNFKTKKGLIKGILTEESDGYLHCAIAKKHPDESIHLLGGKYTTCDKECPDFYFALTKAKVIPKKKIISGPLYLVIADIPMPVALPFGYFPSQKGQRSGILIPAYGEENARGFYLKDGGYYFLFSDYADLALRGDIYTKGSWRLNARSSYRLKYRFNGNFDYQYTHNILGEEGASDYQKTTSYWIKWNHSQDAKARPNTTFSANVNMGSSSFHALNSTRSNDYLSNSFSSSVSYSKRWPNFGLPLNFSANLRHSQNTKDQSVNLSLPVLSMNMSRVYPLKNINKSGTDKWYDFADKLSIGFSSNLENRINTYDSLLFAGNVPMKNGAKHSVPISMALKGPKWKAPGLNLLQYFTLTPQMTWDGVFYTEQVKKRYSWNNDSIITDTLKKIGYGYNLRSSASLSFNPKIYGMYIFKNAEKLKAIRHVLTPSVSFNYSPEMGLNPYRYSDSIQVDDASKMHEYSIYETGLYNLALQHKKSGTISFGLNNILEMKVKNEKDTVTGDKKVKLIESFSLNSGYNVFADSMNWSNISMSGRTNLFNFLNITINGTFDPYSVDTATGQRINKYEFTENHKIARLTSIRLTTGFSLNSQKIAEKRQAMPDNIELIGDHYYDLEYVDFDIPWDFRIDYSLNYSKTSYNIITKKFDPTITQSLRFSGNFSLTEKWKISGSSGYDFVAKDFTYTTLNIHRDLHCWEMSMSWIPFGARQSYNFQINVKSQIFQDVKYNKRKTWQDNLY